MNAQEAFAALFRGNPICRSVWTRPLTHLRIEGKGTFVTAFLTYEEDQVKTSSWRKKHGRDKQRQSRSWVPRPEDLIAEDWEIYKGPTA